MVPFLGHPVFIMQSYVSKEPPHKANIKNYKFKKI